MVIELITSDILKNTVPRLLPSQKAIKASETSAISSFLMGPAYSVVNLDKMNSQLFFKRDN